MRICKQCEVEIEGKGNRAKEFCSDRCRMKHNRLKANSQTEQIEPEQPKANKPEQPCEAAEYTTDAVEILNDRYDIEQPDPGTLAHYQANSELYITRQEPDKLNWGKWMTWPELHEAGLKANRVAIPGDWDYAGSGAKQGAVA